MASVLAGIELAELAGLVGEGLTEEELATGLAEAQLAADREAATMITNVGDGMAGFDGVEQGVADDVPAYLRNEPPPGVRVSSAYPEAQRAMLNRAAIAGGAVSTAEAANQITKYMRQRKGSVIRPPTRDDVRRKRRPPEDPDSERKRKKKKEDMGRPMPKNQKHAEGEFLVVDRIKRVSCKTPRWAYMPRIPRLLQQQYFRYVLGANHLSEADYTNQEGQFRLKYVPTGVDSTSEAPIHCWKFLDRESSYSSGFALFGDGKWNGLTARYLGSTPNPQRQFSDFRYTETTAVLRDPNESNYEYREAIARRIQVNLMLYAREKSSITYRITFAKLTDEAIDPSMLVHVPTRFDADRSRRYWDKTMYQLTQTPAAMPLNFKGQVSHRAHEKFGWKILGSFRYYMREKLSTEDSLHKQVVKFTLHPNHRVNYKWQQGDKGVDGPHKADMEDDTDNPNDKGLETLRDVYLGTPSAPTKEQIYMFIQCDDYTSPAEQTANSDAPAEHGGDYDISWKTFYDVPRQLMP